MKPPCGTNCPNRCRNCHSICDPYLKYQAERIEQRKRSMLDGIINGYEKVQCDRAIKSHAKKFSKGA